jgi:3-oxoacyl-[acyl-carrier protein] reductase
MGVLDRFRLDGKVAVVTGGTRGLGRVMAEALGSAGASVALSARNAEQSRAAAEGVGEATGARALGLVADVTSDRDVRAMVARVLDEFGRIDILVNNAGIYPVGPTETLPDSDLDALLAVNVRAPHVLAGALAPGMAERGDGIIVNIGSWMARMGSPFGAMYTATKAAVEQLTRSWSAEYGPRGVRVNTVAPGITATPGNAGAQTVVETMAKQWTPVGVPVRPVDIAFAVRYLTLPDAAFLHASRIDVDGGVNLTRVA